MTQSIPTHDVVVAGAGFAGLYAIYAARRMGLSVAAVEAASDVGGVWYWNKYPGARCDVESIDYSYSFDAELQRDWRWSERYATQPEILAYARHVAARFNLRPHIRFNDRIITARFDEDTALWTVTTASGETYTARWFISAVGSLSTPIAPEIPGIDTFAGRVIFTATWPDEEIDFTGKRVAIIGTGASAMQSMPLIAKHAAAVTVFQRSANYSVPVFNRALSDADWEEVQRSYPERRQQAFASGGGSPHRAHPRPFDELSHAEREAAFAQAWGTGGVLFGKVFERQTIDPHINDAARAFAENQIRAIVKDPQTAADLIPVDQPLGVKRICTDDGYFEAFNLPHVALVNLRRTPITAMTPTAVQTAEDTYPCDILILATGFDAMTGSVVRMDIRGPRGDSLADLWQDGPQTYLGMLVAGLPNFFNISGPGSPSVLSNMILGAEHQVNWVMTLITHARTRGFTTVEPRRDAAEEWTEHVADVAGRTLFVKGNSWYLGSNISGKPRVFMPYLGGFAGFIAICDEVREADYKGLVFSA